MVDSWFPEDQFPPMRTRPLTLAVAALCLVACGPSDDPDATPSATTTSATTTTLPTATPTSTAPSPTPMAEVTGESSPTTTPTAPAPTPAPTTAPTTAPTAAATSAGQPSGRAEPPLSVEPAPVPPPTGEAATRLVERLSDLDYEVFSSIQDVGADEEKVREIASRLYVGEALEGFVGFAMTVGQDIPLPDQALPIQDVRVLETGPGCMFVVYRLDLGSNIGTVQSRLVATGDRDDPAWRIESQYQEGDTATCQTG